MSNIENTIKADLAYLDEVRMGAILKQFTVDAMAEEPANLYKFMEAWAKNSNARAGNSGMVPAENVNQHGDSVVGTKEVNHSAYPRGRLSADKTNSIEL